MRSMMSAPYHVLSMSSFPSCSRHLRRTRNPDHTGRRESQLAFPDIVSPIIGARRGDCVHATGAIVRTLDRHRIFSRSEEHTSELQSPMRTSYAVLSLKKKQTSTALMRTISATSADTLLPPM